MTHSTLVHHVEPEPRVRVASPARADIQGLRAVAVLAVLLYHLWPHRLTGGYVGVDIFLVISGFLITTHLLRSPVRGVSGLLDFWARRVRRLIPAATLVLLVTLVASWLWLPATVQGQVAREVAAAALYVENWQLARSATDYLATDQLHSPVQHYWSLSVEEQFYLLWPVLIGLTTWAAVRRRAGWVPGAVIALVVAASLAWSVHLTSADPAAAYFVSTTRFWELGIGALLAVVLVSRPVSLAAPIRAVLAWAGLAAMAWAVLTFDAETSFPGLAALVPTVGAALVILAQSDDAPYGPGRAFGAKPVQWLGDVSYSVYLWHWPLIVILPFVLGDELSWPVKLGIIGATLVLAAATKRWVEDPLRWNRRLSRRQGATFAFLLACVLVVCGGAWAASAKAAADVRADTQQAQEALAAAQECLGADALRDADCGDPTGDELVTTPELAKTDKPIVYADGCWNDQPFDTRINCTYGASEHPEVRIALVGNSHAGHWMPALQEVLAERPSWQLTTYLQSVCYTVDVPIVFDGEGLSEGCQETNQWAIDGIAEGGYDLVIMSNRTYAPLVGVDAADKGEVAGAAYQQVIDRFTEAGSQVLVLRDTPAMKENVPDCVAANSEEWSLCSTPAEQALEQDPLAEAAGQDTSGRVSVTDINDLICSDGQCLPVVGGVVAFFDHGHLSATFARTLAPELRQAVTTALAPS